MTPFGKDASLLQNVGSFRQRSGQFSVNRARPASRGGVPYFVDQYIPPTTDSDTIALLDGQYEHTVVDNSGDEPRVVPVKLEFVQFREHYDGATRKSAICSAGPYADFKELRNACNGCDIFWATLEPNATGRKESTRMSRQDKFAFSMIDFSTYHLTPQFDPSGRPRISQKTNKQYMNWRKCEGRGCDGCKAKYETKFGHNPHWPMPWGYFDFLREKEIQIGKSCKSCGGIETLRSDAWVCTNCKAAAIDMTATHLKTEEIKKITEKFYTCVPRINEDGEQVGCGHTGFLKEAISCTACSHAERMSIFDVEFKVLRIPQGQNKSVLDVSNWVKRRPLTGELAELGKPKDLLKLFSPTPNKTQLDKFGPPPIAASEGNGQDTQKPDESRAYGDQYRP
jgi:hypothetical protein